ncbi:hypothetical protein O988_08436 [Pseudogymnoascus sp. VKM F-3808]|nr:hypothetical protein O988_08436 [Pseudogymnoascus sp. VKM F-3808]
MPASFQEILNSSVIKFVVGEGADGEATDFLVHKEAMAQLSEPFRDMLNGESTAESVTWRNVGKSSFERLAQFAYTGDYTVPKPLRRRGAVDRQEAVENEASPDILDRGLAVEEDSAPAPGDTPAEDEPPMPVVEYSEYVEQDSPGWWPAAKPAPRVPSPDQYISKKKAKRMERFASRIAQEELQPEPVPEPISPIPVLFELDDPRDKHKDDCEPSKQFDPKGNYSNVFRSHAELWIIASSYGIDSLMALSLYKLRQTLIVFRINDQTVSDLVDLVHYVYNPHMESLEDERQRGLVAQYMACNSATLSSDGNFMALLREGGSFVEDFLKIVMKRF